MADAHKNFASSLVATAPSPATSGTSLVVTTGEGTKFPTAPFNATIWPTGANPTTANAEIVRVTAVSTDTLTITRAQEGTSARTVVVGDQIVAGITAKTLTDVEATAQIFSGFYGDGSDGNVTVTGGTTTLTRDMYYDTLTISGTGILKPAGFRVHCKTALIVQASGSVNVDGLPGAGATAGAATYSTGTLGSTGGGAGGGGGTAAGTSATAPSNMLGGASGNGGLGASGAGGFGRAVNSPATNAGTVRSTPWATLGHTVSGGVIVNLAGGSGGGGGGGDSTNSGGGGGGGGGCMVLNARTVTNSGSITATGGAGGNATAGNCGGGGGAGGGSIIVNTSQAITGSAPTAGGGAGGTKTGTGVAGVAGSAGSVFVNVWS